MGNLSHEEAIKILRKMVQDAGTKVAVAKQLDISPAYLGDILNGVRPISDRVASKLGYRRVVQYVPVKNGAQ